MTTVVFSNICIFYRQYKNHWKCVFIDLLDQNQPTLCFSPWANGGPFATPWSSISGTILFRGPSGIILAMLPEKKMGLTTNFGHFPKWPLQNLRFSISRKLLHVGSWFGGSKPIFSWSRNKINILYNMADHYYVCKKTKNMKKSKMAANFKLKFGKCVITFVLVATKRWFFSCMRIPIEIK